MAPPVTPSLVTDRIELGIAEDSPAAERRELNITEACVEKIGESRVRVSTLLTAEPSEDTEVFGYVNGIQAPSTSTSVTSAGCSVAFEADFLKFQPPKPIYGGFGYAVGKVVALILVLHREGAKGKLILLDHDKPIGHKAFDQPNR